MNTPFCCPKCIGAYKNSDLDKGICRNPSCPCHQPKLLTQGEKESIVLVDLVKRETVFVHQPQDWREAFDEKFTALEFAGAEVTRKAVKDFIESLLLKSYEEGKDFGYKTVLESDGALHYEIGKAEGRAAIIAELLAAWPHEEKVNEISYEPSNEFALGQNEALRTTRAIIESKRTTK